ncbi:hypothetical protein SAMN05216410_1177 [Sanguibacter gelidistatuariae]|uniref:FAR-17a/AIG1-like protein n=1 Tax=Sanguibacter gelidistatuariae TaxID=1814289 RepID=A0A1G6HQS6_9MICO|nr:Pr6Pr family membrane protein [Sanguibacter gelidistatuariae]SDB96551.1 hypothetical protein SAMN05216410_1177 [Sanguibacter gelidistatuariae]
MPSSVPLSRVWNALVAALVVVAVLMELSTALVDGPGIAGSMLERLIRLFSYFTIQSNVLIGVACALLVWRPQLDGAAFRVLRLVAVLCITVTGIVYNTVLRGNGADLAPAGAFSNALLHVAVPVLAVAGWLLFGPRPRVDRLTTGLVVLYPLAWVAYTFVRGAIVDWYPYPFLDVGEIGYGRALLHTGIVAVVFLVLAALAGLVDRSLPATAQTPVAVARRG